MSTPEDKGPGRGRGQSSVKGFESDQQGKIDALAALVDELDARVVALEGTTPVEPPPA